IDSSAAPRPISGRAPAPSPLVSLAPSCILYSALDRESACASVLATMKVTPSSLASSMLLTALPPAPPKPNTMIFGLSSVASRALKLTIMSPPLQLDKVGGQRVTTVAHVLRSPFEAIFDKDWHRCRFKGRVR